MKSMLHCFKVSEKRRLNAAWNGIPRPVIAKTGDGGGLPIRLTKGCCAYICLWITFASSPVVFAQTWTNFIRQTQYPSGVQWDVPVISSGNQLAPLPIDQSGARFQLWTVGGSTNNGNGNNIDGVDSSNPGQGGSTYDPSGTIDDEINQSSYLLDTQYVGTYVPSAQVMITSEDPYAVIPRTRADRPFSVVITVSGLLSGADDPVASKSVCLRHYVQSYGLDGTGTGIDRDLATQVSEASINGNGTTTLSYAINSVPGSDRAKVRGEERFAVFSLPDYQAAEGQLASCYIQIWPVASGGISGLTQNARIKSAMPTLTLTLDDLYPSSQTYAQVYRGEPQLGTKGTIVPGSALVVTDSVPRDAVLTISDWDDVFTGDGRWTLELLTSTVFGLDRLAYVSFDLDRTIRVNGSVTTGD